MEAPQRLLQAVSRLPRDALRDILQQLQAKVFLFTLPPNSEPRHRFKHALIQQAVYQSIPLLTGRRLPDRAAVGD
ncbi:MAG: hypothetical protein R3F37_09505 [Candidatus Competibacteraceae bacterium]